MTGTTVSLAYGEHPAKEPHKFSTQTDKDSLAQQRVMSYMATQNGGGDPVTALAVRGKTSASSISERRDEVARLLRDNTALYENRKHPDT
ncbi:hypothetical protein HD806DRAFT_535110 [Xylariaceae sp. AK1471]|nr:hypothetical protein HD806DRAFT_535110 [Xylariaceae sp. AK1471]